MRALIDRYRDLLPVTDATPVVSLGEGATPLVPLRRLSRDLGLRLYAKLEGMNPTASFKDRGMTVAVSKAVEEGAEAVICASTGNTSASAAAYAARAGITAAVVIPEGRIAAGKLAQALVHGARVLALEGNFDDALEVVRALVERHPIALVNSLNQFRLEGQKTGAFEVCDELGDAPDALCIPVGNAGNVSAYWLGFQAYREAERSRGLPRLYGFQAAGAAPLVRGERVERPETVATAIRIGNPARGAQALEAMRASGGGVDAVSDEEILDAYRLLAQGEGIFCEPASAAAVAGVLKRARAGGFAPDERVVCVLTGHGLKDPDTALASSESVVRLPARVEAVEEALLG
jgi:threonine synthase